jgi:hypothetical protein
MSRRNPIKHEPAPSDTPLATVRPLIPHLSAARVRTFCEPCCGEGDLVRHLESFGLRCTYQGDITTGQDALDIERFDDPPITNLPFSKHMTKMMLALIRHFIDHAPYCWVLVPLDRISNRYMKPFMPHCTDIVSAGRNKTLQDGGQGYDEFAWLRFERAHTSGGAIYHSRYAVFLLRMATRACASCGRAFQPQRTTARFCSATCRQRAHRERSAERSLDAVCPAGACRARPARKFRTKLRPGGSVLVIIQPYPQSDGHVLGHHR